jgi:hypothetical protein
MVAPTIGIPLSSLSPQRLLPVHAIENKIDEIQKINVLIISFSLFFG